MGWNVANFLDPATYQAAVDQAAADRAYALARYNENPEYWEQQARLANPSSAVNLLGGGDQYYTYLAKELAGTEGMRAAALQSIAHDGGISQDLADIGSDLPEVLGDIAQIGGTAGAITAVVAGAAYGTEYLIGASGAAATEGTAVATTEALGGGTVVELAGGAGAVSTTAAVTAGGAAASGASQLGTWASILNTGASIYNTGANLLRRVGIDIGGSDSEPYHTPVNSFMSPDMLYGNSGFGGSAYGASPRSGGGGGGFSIDPKLIGIGAALLALFFIILIALKRK